MQTGKFIELNSQRRAHVVDMPASSYRPSPPSTRVRMQTEPDRQLVEDFEPPKTEHTLRSVPEPPKDLSEMAGSKKGRKRASDEHKSIAVARVEALVGAGEQLQKALGKVGKEIGSSPLSVRQWVFKARKQEPAKKRAGKKAGRRVEATIAEHLAPEPRFDGLDLILDIIELCERAKEGLTKSQRARLRATLNDRLS